MYSYTVVTEVYTILVYFFIMNTIIIYNTESSGNITNCIYTYITQPPSEIGCNVYANSLVILECSAATIDPTNYTIQWYFEGELLTNVFTNTLQTETRQPGVSTIYFRLSTLFLTRSNVQPGRYYCLIQLMGSNSTDIEFLPSNMLNIGTEESLQNASLCNTSRFSISQARCALTEDVTTAIIPSTTMASDHSSVTFPIWGFIVASLGSIIVLVIVIVSLVSMVVYVRRRRRVKQSEQSVHIHVYEERSDQNSTSTDHIYEELDICLSEIEHRQNHFTSNALESEAISEIDHSPQQNMESEEQGMEHQQQQNLESEECEMVEYRLQYSSETESESSSTYEESEKNNSSKGYDKLQIIKPPPDLVINNYYDQLDPQLNANFSYNKRELLDPQLIDNPSYSNQLDPLTIRNQAYNKRDELDPKTDVCPAYAMNPISVT